MAQGSDNWEASADVLTQVEAIEEALAFFGHIPKRLVFTRDAGAFLEKMRSMEIEVVFNLCETVDEDPALCWHPAAVLELLGMPFSGSPSQALMMTADKAVAKQLLLANRIATPGFRLCDGSETFAPSGLRFPVIVKPRFEDASIGIDQESIFETPETLSAGIESFKARFGSVLVEEFVDGREFNVSLFGYPKVRVLPLAEIDFSAFPEDMYRIVGYRAKWDRGSFEYDHTPRDFSSELSESTRTRIHKTALACFHLFQLRDYGRVDMRIDERGQVFVLEVNANPCLSPDAGLAASYMREGSSHAKMVDDLCHCIERRMFGNENKTVRAK